MYTSIHEDAPELGEAVASVRRVRNTCIAFSCLLISLPPHSTAGIRASIDVQLAILEEGCPQS